MRANMTQERKEPITIDKLQTKSGIDLIVEKRLGADRIELLLRVPNQKKCVLHWGVRSGAQQAWHRLPQTIWPENTSMAGPAAMQTTFMPHNGESRISIALPPGDAPEFLAFAL